MEILRQASGLDIFVGAFAMSILVLLMGAIANGILKSSGFGTLVNGVLLVLGAVFGVMARMATIGFQ